MDFAFPPEQEALRKALEEYAVELMKDAPAGWGTSLGFQYPEVGWEYSRCAHRKLTQKGWLVRHWPVRCGGGNAPVTEQLLLNQVMGYYRIPAANAFGIGMIGPTLLAERVGRQSPEATGKEFSDGSRLH